MMRNLAFLLGGNLASWSVSLLFWLTLPRLLGPATFGEFTLGLAVSGLALSIGGLGIATYLLKQVARDRGHAGKYVGTGLVTHLMLAALVVPSVFLFAVVAHYGAHTRAVVVLFTLSAACAFLVTPAVIALQALEHMHLNTMIALVRQVIGALTAVSLALIFRFDILELILVVLTFNVVTSVLQLYVTNRIVSIRFGFDLSLFRRLITGGLPFWSNGVFLTTYVWIDSVLLSVLTPARELGYYAAPVQAISTLGFLPGIVTTVIFPALSRGYPTDQDTVRRLTRLSLQGLISIGMPISIGALLVGPATLEMIFGAAFRPSGLVFMVLAFTVVPSYIATLAYWVLAAADRQRLWAYVMGVSAVVNPLINLATIPYFQNHAGHGSLGAAVALLVTDTAVGTAGLLLIPRALLRPFRPLVVGITKAAVATIAMAVAVSFWHDWPVPARILVGATVFVAAAAALGVFTFDDADLWASVRTRLWRRLERRPKADVPA